MIRGQGSFPGRSERGQGKRRDYLRDLLYRRQPCFPLPLIQLSGSGSGLANAPWLQNLNRWLTPLPPILAWLLLKHLLGPDSDYQGRFTVNEKKEWQSQPNEWNSTLSFSFSLWPDLFIHSSFINSLLQSLCNLRPSVPSTEITLQSTDLKFIILWRSTRAHDGGAPSFHCSSFAGLWETNSNCLWYEPVRLTKSVQCIVSLQKLPTLNQILKR